MSGINGPDKNEGSLVGGHWQAVASGAPHVVGATGGLQVIPMLSPTTWSTGVQHNSMPAVGSLVTSMNGV